MRTPWMKLAIGIPLVALVLATAGPWLYINVIREDAPERLSLDGATDSQAPATTQLGPTSVTTAEIAGAEGGVNGTWKVTSGSQAGYRVDEVLFGQSATAVGRTDDVTGQIQITGNRVVSGSFSVDMTKVSSDESRRDNQFRGRIMDVATYPTSTFRLTSPVQLPSLPADGREVMVEAIGDLTLRGTTKQMTVKLAAQRSGSSIRVAGTIPIVFDEWGIPNPSFGPAETEDHGELEFRLVFSR